MIDHIQSTRETLIVAGVILALVIVPIVASEILYRFRRRTGRDLATRLTMCCHQRGGAK